MILYRNHTGVHRRCSHCNDCTAHGLGPLQDAFAELMDGAAPSTCFSLLTGGWLVVGLDTLSDDQVSKTSSRHRSWASFSLLSLHSHSQECLGQLAPFVPTSVYLPPFLLQPNAGGGRVSPRELAWLQGVLCANAGTLALGVKAIDAPPCIFH